MERRSPEKVRASDKARYDRDREKRLAQQAAYFRTRKGKEAKQRAVQKWIKDNPEKRRAQNAVSNAIRDGKLIRGTVCEKSSAECKGRIHAHHDDYAKPLDVRWLCDLHHKVEHTF